MKGESLICSYDKKPCDLKDICVNLRQGVVKSSKQEIIIEQFPDSAYDLLKKLLDLDSDKRYTASDALKHPFFHQSN